MAWNKEIVLPGWTRILDSSSGSYMTLEDMSDVPLSPVYLDNNFVINSSKTSCLVKDNGQKELFHIVAKTGKTIDVTEEARFLTPSRWTPLKELNLGDFMAVPNKIDMWGRNDISDTDVKLLAYMIGDGSCLNNRTRFTKDPNSRQIEEVAELVQAYGCELHHYDSSLRYNFDIRKLEYLHDPTHLNGVKRMLTNYGIYGHRAAGKFIPQEIFMAPKETAAIFLSRLFATDGWASVSRSGDAVIAQIGYASTSKELIYGVAHLLLRFGIGSNICQKQTGCYELSVTSKAGIIMFATEIGIYGKEEAVASVLDVVERRTDTSPLLPIEFNESVKREMAVQEITIPEMEFVLTKAVGRPQHLNLKKHRLQKARAAIIAEALQMDNLSKIVSGDIDWVEIKEISSIGKHKTHTLSCPDGNVLANDMLIG